MPLHLHRRPFSIVLLASAVVACGSGTADGDPGTPAIGVVVQPPTATVPVSGVTSFTATVTSSVDTSVAWSVEPAGCGSVTQSGSYAAPSTTGTCIVRATSRADPTRSGNATVTVTAIVEPPPDPISPSVRVQLAPQAGVSGRQRVNFALPMPPGHLQDATLIRIAAVPGSGAELPAARRILARWPDGSIRSVQIQVDVDVSSSTALDMEVGTATTAGSLALVDVADTLAVADGTDGPRVWAVLPSKWLASSQAAGPVVEQSTIAGTPLDAWGGVCDYAMWDIDAFLAQAAGREAWLFDRPAAMYLGYAMTGARVALESGYREAAMYRAGITGTGSATRIGVPTATDDLKYHYTQGLAIHYLLTGDDRFREAAEDVAIRAHDLWPSPGYAGGADFWTERHAGFALLAYEWAAAISDDRASTFAPWADEAVASYLAMQAVSASAWEPDARCFAHSADAHGENYGYVGCSPWMSAILADGLDTYARRVGDSGATAARRGLVLLGQMIARHGRDAVGRPYYWMGAGVAAAEADPYDEHWGESAYVVALAWHWSGRSDAGLRTAAMDLIDGLRTRGEAGQLRSFNWQCRSAPMAAYFLRQ